MGERESNALLPPMEEEDFQTTDIYLLLLEHEPAVREICRFLSADSLDMLEFVANPARGLYTHYGQEDFDEILAYTQYCGKIVSTQLTFHSWRLVPVETEVGNFVVCYDATQKVIGILS